MDDSSNRIIVKICGITRAQDGLAALEAGADWLGFIRAPGTPRYRELDDCARTLAEIRAAAPRPFEAVGVYVDATAETIRTEVKTAGFDRVQLHGGESAGFVATISALGISAIKTIKIRDARSIEDAEIFPEDIPILADAYDPRVAGGTGRAYDASILAPLVARRRVIVAGGLTPESVGAIVASLRPYGVDVSSGIESSPGVKDRGKVEKFLKAVRRAAV